MKKIIFSIIFFSILGIVLFIIYLPQNLDRNDILYGSLVTYKDITYKTNKEENINLDILMPTHEIYDKIPVVIYVHGGDFISGEKSDLTLGTREDTVPKLLAKGYAIISINYRLLGGLTHLPSNIIDVKDSIRYIHSVANIYNFDENNISLWGSDTGAYLALVAAYSPSGLYLGEYSLRSYSAEVNFVIDMYGPTKLSNFVDVDSMSTQELVTIQGNLDMLYGDIYDVYNLNASDYTEMSSNDPLSYVSNDTVPTLIIHGTADQKVDLSQSELLEGKLTEYSIEYEFHQILNVGHDLSGISDAEILVVSSYILNFIDGHYVS